MRCLIHTGFVRYALTDDLRDIGIGDDALFRKPLQDMRALAEAVRILAMDKTPHRGE
ncbi:MAG TPA: hypothetical protein PKO23_01585 [Candidatus Hydrogenedentes bacterium]|nr:hypothetical protein [Candidatus Hydrogenedentota bacterium]